MLRNLRRGFALALVSALGCNDVTMELLPKPPAATAGRAGGDTLASGGAAASGMTGGMGGRPGSGGMGNAGNPSDAGSDDGPPGGGTCGATGCGNSPGCSDACKVCKDDRDCGPDLHCDVAQYRCVECRSTYDECPLVGGCASDCPPDRSQCDWATNTCQKPCTGQNAEPCEPGLTCNFDRDVCVECNFNKECVETGRGQVCLKPQNICAECAVGFNSQSPNSLSPNCEDPDRPICRFSDFACHPCEYDGECGPKPWECTGGRCVHPQTDPQP